MRRSSNKVREVKERGRRREREKEKKGANISCRKEQTDRPCCPAKLQSARGSAKHAKRERERQDEEPSMYHCTCTCI